MRKPSFVLPFSCTRCLPHCREVPCSFFAQGRCRHGGNCRFFHTPAVPGADESAALLCDSGSVQWRPLARIVNASNHCRIEEQMRRHPDFTDEVVERNFLDGHFRAGIKKVLSFYISHGGSYAATRTRGAPCDPGSPSQTLWVGGDRAWPPCPRSGRRRSTHCGVRRAVGGGKGASSSISSSYMTRSTSVFRAAREA